MRYRPSLALGTDFGTLCRFLKCCSASGAFENRGLSSLTTKGFFFPARSGLSRALWPSSARKRYLLSLKGKGFPEE